MLKQIIIMTLFLFTFLNVCFSQVNEKDSSSLNPRTTITLEFEGFFPHSTLVKIKKNKKLEDKPIYFQINTPSEYRLNLDPVFYDLTKNWINKHPQSSVVIIHKLPIIMKSGELYAIQTYVWVIDGNNNLNLELVRIGACKADVMLLDKQEEKNLVIERKDYDEFKKKVLKAEEEAKKEKLGIWKYT